MEVLFTFLNWVSSFSHVDEDSGSKMDIHNLATVITPNIIHRGKEHVPVEDSFLAIEAVHSLIECNESMCEVSFRFDNALQTISTLLTQRTGAGRPCPHPERLLSLQQRCRAYDKGDPPPLRGPCESASREHTGDQLHKERYLRRCIVTHPTDFFCRPLQSRWYSGCSPRRYRSQYGHGMAERELCSPRRQRSGNAPSDPVRPSAQLTRFSREPEPLEYALTGALGEKGGGNGVILCSPRLWFYDCFLHIFVILGIKLLGFCRSILRLEGEFL